MSAPTAAVAACPPALTCTGMMRRQRPTASGATGHRFRAWRRAGYALAWVLLLLAVFGDWQTQQHGRIGYAVVSGHSMDPTYATGDLLITRSHVDYHIGQVVVYGVPKGEPAAGSYVVHRLVGGSDAVGWTTQGENNAMEDIWHPHDVDIQGTTLMRIPWGGYVVRHARDPLLYALLGAVYIGYLMWPRQEDEVQSRPGHPDDSPFATS